MEHLLELLKQKFSGVRQDVLAQLAASIALVATTEDEQKSSVEKLTAAQVEAFGKEYRKTVDAEVSNGTKTFEENLRKKYDLVEKGKVKQDPPKDPEPAPEPEPEPRQKSDPKQKPQAAPPTKTEPVQKTEAEKQIEAMQKKIESLEGVITGMQKEGISKNRSARYNEIVGGCTDEGLKAILLRQFQLLEPLDDEAFDKQLEMVKGDVAKANQVQSERQLPKKPVVNIQPSDEQKEIKAQTDAMVKKLNLP